jgi:hypothetical protein
VRTRIGWWLRCWADRIDPHNAPRITGMTLTLETDKGWVLHPDGGKGMRIAYLGRAEYDKAHTEATSPPRRIDWVNARVYPPGTSERDFDRA